MSYGSLVDAIVNRHRGNRFEEYQDLIQGSEYLVKNFEKTQVLAGHNGCVNSVLFSEDGSLAITGSDDETIKLYDICNGVEKMSISTVHDANIFFAKDRPYSQCTEILSCGADGKVVHIPDLMRITSQRVLFEHFGRAHRLALMPNSADELYSCGEDGRVMHYDLRDRNTPSLRMRFMCQQGIRRPIYAIGINPAKPHEVALGGDDQYVRIFDTRATVVTPVRELCPTHMQDATAVCVTGLRYDHSGREVLMSYNGSRHGDIFIMPADTAPLARHPHEEEEETGFEVCRDSSYRGLKSPCHEHRVVFRGHSNVQTVKQVNYMGAHSEFVVSSRSGSLLKAFLADSEGAVNCLTPHPSLPLLATSGLSSEAMLWSPGELHTNGSRRYEAEEEEEEDDKSGTSPSGETAHSSIEAFINRVLIPGGWRAQSDVVALRHLEMIGDLAEGSEEEGELDFEESALRARVLQKANREVKEYLYQLLNSPTAESSDENSDDDSDDNDDDEDGRISEGSEEVERGARPVGDLPLRDLHRALLAFDRARGSVDTMDRQQEQDGRGRRRGRAEMEESGREGSDSASDEERRVRQGRAFRLADLQDVEAEECDSSSSSSVEEDIVDLDDMYRRVVIRLAAQMSAENELLLQSRLMRGGADGVYDDDNNDEAESSDEEESDDEDEDYDSSSTDDPYEDIIDDVDFDTYDDEDNDISNRELGQFDNVD
jgi:DDB1- and CUL4-associated factor 8